MPLPLNNNLRNVLGIIPKNALKIHAELNRVSSHTKSYLYKHTYIYDTLNGNFRLNISRLIPTKPTNRRIVCLYIYGRLAVIALVLFDNHNVYVISWIEFLALR